MPARDFLACSEPPKRCSFQVTIFPFGDQLDTAPDVQSTLQLLFEQLGEALSLLSASLEHGSFDTEQLARKARLTDTTATELANELVASSGLTFQDAYRLSGDLATALNAAKRPWQSLTPCRPHNAWGAFANGRNVGPSGVSGRLRRTP